MVISIIALALLNAALLAYHVWKDWTHRKQIEALQLLVKAKDVPEFVQAVAQPEPAADAEPESDLVNPEEAGAETLIKAIQQQ